VKNPSGASRLESARLARDVPLVPFRKERPAACTASGPPQSCGGDLGQFSGGVSLSTKERLAAGLCARGPPYPL
jgi:hypothetical protein